MFFLTNYVINKQYNLRKLKNHVDKKKNCYHENVVLLYFKILHEKNN